MMDIATVTKPGPSAVLESYPEEDPDVGLRRWTRDEYHRMAEVGLINSDERTELLDGEIWRTMAPQKRPHFRTIRAVADALETAFGPGYDVQQQGPVVFSDASEPEPDVAVLTGSWTDYNDHPTAADVRLLAEVSDSTLAKDRTRKARDYARAGIADYWIVNLVDRQLEVYRDPAPEGVYRSVTVHAAGEWVRPLHAPQAAVSVAALLPPTPPNQV